eukprot:g19795.t1
MLPRRRTPASQDDGSGGNLSNTLRGGASAAGGRARAAGAGSPAGGGGITLSGASGSLVLGDGIPVPEYGTFSRAESARFNRECDEYKRKQLLGNSGQSVQGQLLTVAQLLPRNIRVSLRRRIFPTERGELSEAKLLEALARHGQCWTGHSMDPSDASTKMAKVMRMGQEATAADRVDAVLARMEKFFQDRSAETFFLNFDGSFKRGPARVITQAFVAGLKPAGFQDKCMHELNVREGWKSDPELMLEIVLAAAAAWRTVEDDATFRQRAEARGKSGRVAASTKSRSSSSQPQRSTGGAPTCHTCGAVGHKSADCKSAGKPGSASGGAAQGAARPQGHRQST